MSSPEIPATLPLGGRAPWNRRMLSRAYAPNEIASRTRQFHSLSLREIARAR